MVLGFGVLLAAAAVEVAASEMAATIIGLFWGFQLSHIASERWV